MTRKSYIRNPEVKYNFVHNLKASYQELFRQARKEHWSRERLMQERRLRTNKQLWQRLTALDQADLMGYWDALEDTLLAEMVFSYEINGKYYTPGEVIDRKDNTDPNRDCHTKNSYYLYPNTNMVFC